MDGSTIGPEAFADGETEPSVEPMFGTSGENSLGRDCVDWLCRAGLRPTPQRMRLGSLLLSNAGRHVTASTLHAEAVSASMQLSLATVYNTLNVFTDAGLLRRIGIDGSKSFFDTNPAGHHHFFVDSEDRLLDVPEPGVEIDQLPQPLPGYEISRVDVVVHLRRKRA
jgi:Fur family transcriptional regulator, iron response regulator